MGAFRDVVVAAVAALPRGLQAALAVGVVVAVFGGGRIGEVVGAATSAGSGFVASAAGTPAAPGDGAVADVRALPRPAAAPDLPGGPWRDVLDGAVVSGDAPAHGGYDRTAFLSGWTDYDGNGCDTRDDVLARDFDGEAVDGCEVRAGTGELTSVYDGESLTDPSGVDVDHVVALGWAWASGAGGWDDATRRAFAQDPANLVAVSASSNRSKGDAGPDRWEPPAGKGAECWYADRFLRVAVAYDLVLTPAERDAVHGSLRGCP